MKRCPTCDRTYTDPSLNFCLEDGTPLATDAPAFDPNATVRYPSARDTAEPPPTEIYRPEPAVTTPRRKTPVPTPRPPAPAPAPPPQWTPGPTGAPPPRKKSNAIWWIVGGLITLIVVGAGFVVLLIALASLSTNTNNANANGRNDNRNANVTTNANTNNANANANTNTNATVPASFTDDFSEQKWSTGQSPYGKIWYSNGEYHMTSFEEKFVVMYAPSNDYSTENATVKVTARSVNGQAPSAGFGLMVHCLQTRDKKLEDYALLIFPSDEPAYEIIMHKAGVQSALVQKTTSSAIRSGSSPNQLEVRIRGAELSFYANGQLLTKVTDTANFRRGRAGFYTSGPYEVAFDDLRIEH